MCFKEEKKSFFLKLLDVSHYVGYQSQTFLHRLIEVELCSAFAASSRRVYTSRHHQIIAVIVQAKGKKKKKKKTTCVESLSGRPLISPT